MTRRSKPLARRATAEPMRPSPTMPSVAPDTSRPRNGPLAQWVSQRPARTRASPSTTRRRAASMSAIARSAVAASRTTGVFVTAMPRARQASMSIRSYPTPKFATRRSPGRSSSTASSTVSFATINTSTSSRRLSSAPISTSRSSFHASPGSRFDASTRTTRD